MNFIQDARESREREKQGEEKLRALQEELSLLQQSRSMDDLQVQKTISDLSGTVEALRREIEERNLSLPLVSGLEERIVTYSQQLRMSFDEVRTFFPSFILNVLPTNLSSSRLFVM